MSALHDAARGDDPDAVADVLAQGLVEVNTRDKLSRTALIIASWAGKVYPARLLKPSLGSARLTLRAKRAAAVEGVRLMLRSKVPRPDTQDALTHVAAFQDALTRCDALLQSLARMLVNWLAWIGGIMKFR